MAVTIYLPAFAETVVEGVVGKWLKQEGDWVGEEDPLLEVITDKLVRRVRVSCWPRPPGGRSGARFGTLPRPPGPE